MSQPKLASAQSGLGGRGYRNPFTGEVVPSVTTCLGALEKGGVLQWSVDAVAAYAAVNAEELLSRTEDQAFRMLRYYHTRFKSEQFDDPEVDLNNVHTGVLNDLADLGTLVHDWIEADLNGWIEPDIVRPEQEQMVVQYLSWKNDQDIVVHATEATLFGDGYAGTADAFVTLNGVPMLLDHKTSRAVRDEHVAQLAALSAADLWVREVTEGTEGAVGFKKRRNDTRFDSWWVADVPPAITTHAVLQLRPDDYDSKGNLIPAFCRLHVIEQSEIDAAFDIFLGGLKVRHGQRRLKEVRKNG